MPWLMRALAIETSAEVASLALFEDGQIVGALEHYEPERHAERIFGLLEQLFAQAPFGKEALDCLILGVGPGSFTGVRVGLALGQGVAAGLSLPMIGVTSLSALAAGARPQAPASVLCPLLDARKGEVFAAAYDATGHELVAPTVLAGEQVQEFFDQNLPTATLTFVGAIAQSLPLRSRVSRAPLSERPSAQTFWKALWPTGAASLEQASLLAPRPVYVREPNLIVPKLVASPFQRP